MSPKTTWRGEPLPRGRHKLGRRTVRASQRERLLRAMVEHVAERGYEATTVPDVVARARVSRNAFYEQFEDKVDCFIAACDDEAAELLGVVTAYASEPEWTSALIKGTTAYLRWWQERHAFARAYFLGLPAAGERATDQRERNYAPFREMFAALAARAREEQPGLPELEPLVPRVLVLAITELIAEEVRAGRGDRLVRLAPGISSLAIRLLADSDSERRLPAQAESTTE